MAELISLQTEIVATGSLMIVKATLKVINPDTDDFETYQAMGQSPNDIRVAENDAVKRVYRFAGISKAGITDK